MKLNSFWLETGSIKCTKLLVMQTSEKIREKNDFSLSEWNLHEKALKNGKSFDSSMKMSMNLIQLKLYLLTTSTETTMMVNALSVNIVQPMLHIDCTYIYIPYESISCVSNWIRICERVCNVSLQIHWDVHFKL